MNCPRCSSEKISKYGHVKGKQRYICKDCRRQFVADNNHGKPQGLKQAAVLLYINGLSFRAIAKLLQVSATAVINWVRAYTEERCERPEPLAESAVIELDEIWQYINSKNASQKYGKPIAVLMVNPSNGNVVTAMNPSIWLGGSRCQHF